MEISNDKLFDILSGINGQLTSLNGNMQTVLEKLSVHEHRLSQHDQELKELKNNKPGMKDNIIQMLIKTVLALVLIVGSLTGASSLIDKFLQQGNTQTQSEVNK